MSNSSNHNGAPFPGLELDKPLEIGTEREYDIVPRTYGLTIRRLEQGYPKAVACLTNIEIRDIIALYQEGKSHAQLQEQVATEEKVGAKPSSESTDWRHLAEAALAAEGVI